MSTLFNNNLLHRIKIIIADGDSSEFSQIDNAITKYFRNAYRSRCGYHLFISAGTGFVESYPPYLHPSRTLWKQFQERCVEMAPTKIQVFNQGGCRIYLLQIGLIKSRFYYFKSQNLKHPWFLDFWRRRTPYLFILSCQHASKNTRKWEHPGTHFFGNLIIIVFLEMLEHACTQLFGFWKFWNFEILELSHLAA